MLLESPFEPLSVMVTDVAHRALADALDSMAAVPVYVVPQHVMNQVTGYNIHRGCLAIGRRPPVRQWRDVAASAQRIVVLERVGNADNIGGVFRNAAAFAADAVLLDPAATDPLYRKAIRTSLGAALTVPFARAEPWPDALTVLGAMGFATVALTPAASAPPLRDVLAPLATQRIALVLGHEGDGLSEAAMRSCDHRARIPIASRVDSINVTTAAAIALYELGV
jgi:tRNA G18 (ribose-2'-O)-methylase SpoU